MKSCKLNSFIEARQKLFWIGNVGNKANTHTSQHKEANMSKSDSSSSCLARSFKNSAWSMSSLVTALQESPSTICSHSHYSHHATEFSTPRDQVRTINQHSFKKNFFFASFSNESFYYNQLLSFIYFVINDMLHIHTFSWCPFVSF